VAKLVYFAWVRQKIGKAEEERTLPEDVTTVRELMAHLESLGPGYEEAFRNPAALRCAVNQEHRNFASAIADSDEIAFFPPVTGGIG